MINSVSKQKYNVDKPCELCKESAGNLDHWCSEALIWVCEECAEHLRSATLFLTTPGNPNELNFDGLLQPTIGNGGMKVRP